MLESGKNIFTDEYESEINSKTREYVKRKVGERNNAKYTTKTVKFSYRYIILWSCIKTIAGENL